MPKAKSSSTPSSEPQRTERIETVFKQLVKQIAKTSKYHEHEVQDILKHLVGHMHIQLSKGLEVNLHGLGKFKRRRVKPSVRYSPLYDKHYLSFTSDSVSFTPSSHLREAMLKGRVEGADKESYLLWIEKLETEGSVPEGTYDIAKKLLEQKQEQLPEAITENSYNSSRQLIMTHEISKTKAKKLKGHSPQ